ncbi:MAG TPA: biopolymer transporter ExbD [Rhizomicrobium sp.]|jgi:biopolymer transport protein ExbD|nr:biopolymer transporter ExbD [Rhizomicrobium sp.]
MAMNVGNESGEGEVMVEMNTTPLIDVMLVLLTLLIITLPIQTHAVKLDMPRPNTHQPPTPPVVVTLEVDFDGTTLWNGTPVDKKTLDGYLQSAAADDPQPEIHLQPNRLAKYDAVAKVLADAQRLGVTHIGFTGIENMQ